MFAGHFTGNDKQNNSTLLYNFLTPAEIYTHQFFFYFFKSF
jgi:hypothetical protein